MPLYLADWLRSPAQDHACVHRVRVCCVCVTLPHSTPGPPHYYIYIHPLARIPLLNRGGGMPQFGIAYDIYVPE